MRSFYLYLSWIVCFLAPGPVAWGDTDVVVDDFETYADRAAMQAKWVSSIGSSTSTFVFNQSTPGQPYPVPPSLGAIDGAAVLFDGSNGLGAGSVNRWVTPFSVVPTATQNVELSVDLGYDNTANGKKLTLGLRYTEGATTENIIELGFWNQLPSPPILIFAHRAALMPGGDSWQPYGLDSAIDELYEMPNTGRGFHRFTAIISLTEITFMLDLFADGKNNLTNAVGLDAIDVVAGATVTANGFNDLRFGVPSATGSSTNPFLAVDNVSLRLVDVASKTADYNGNGRVDAADYTVWRDSLNQAGSDLAADGSGPAGTPDGKVDLYDYQFWKAHFGEGVAVGSINSASGDHAAVPEPATALAAVAAMAFLSLNRLIRHAPAR